MSTEDNEGVVLQLVYPEHVDLDTDIDIIAIHGLNTRSPYTWEWQDRNNPEIKVNWLTHEDMLPKAAERAGIRARIFTCNWPADVFQRATSIQKPVNMFSQLLFEGIQRGLRSMDGHGREDRPILFIASCIGGIILINALVETEEAFNPVRRATRGILFLATPFRGTSFEDVAAWAERGLEVLGRIQDRRTSTLLNIVKGSNFDLESLVLKFTKLSQERGSLCQLFNFYEGEKTILRPRGFRRLPRILFKDKVLVNKSSATLDIIPNPMLLDRPHVLMNKFRGPECSDYKIVAGKIEEMLKKIRETTPRERADVWIREKCYTEDRLKIERLSGAKLPMESCYINLAIVEQSRDVKGSWVPSSLPAHFKTETPNEDVQVQLSAIFDYRTTKNGATIEPKRILIRGRAGVGKTTLCKKIVHDFIHGTWSERFDRILWLPLRRLKTWKPREYNLEELFQHEYFSQSRKDNQFARELSDDVSGGDGAKTLFVFDGLDEVVSGLSTDENLPQLLETLLNQPHVIITSRPHAKLPTNVHPPDLELETIGFYPHQVREYIRRVCDSEGKIAAIQSYIRQRELIQGLVRVPIQLDALCFTWNDSLRHEHTEQTLTNTYQAIEHRLWKKDMLRLRKKHDQEILTQDQIENLPMPNIEHRMEDELLFLEGLAFSGLHNDVIDFESKHLDKISSQFGRGLVLDMFLPHISFLRTSESAVGQGHNYHFLHLTFQEYFAARYFARQWKLGTDLACLELKALESREDGNIYCPNNECKTIRYIQSHKYNTRYSVFWRFVAGLVYAQGGDIHSNNLFRAIEDSPRDLLGPAHQRLVMHCLSEVPSSQEMPKFNQLRMKLEDHLQQWLLFEGSSYATYTRQLLVWEREFPDSVLEATILNASNEVKISIMHKLVNKRHISSKIVDCVGSYLGDEFDSLLEAAILFLFHCHNSWSEELHQRIFVLLTHQTPHIRHDAAEALSQQPHLPKNLIPSLVSLLNNSDEEIRSHAVTVLGNQSTLPDSIIQIMRSLLDHPNKDLKHSAARALCQHSALPDNVIEDMVNLLKWGRETESDLKNYFMAHLPMLKHYIGDMMDSLDRTSLQECLGYKVLRGFEPPLPEAIETMAPLLTHPESNVREIAVNFLSRTATMLSEETIRDVIVMSKDRGSGLRYKAVDCLSTQMTKLEVSQTVVSLLNDSDSEVRYRAAAAIRRNWTLIPDAGRPGREAVMALLHDEQVAVATGGIELGWQHMLVDQSEIWKTVEVWLEKPDPTKTILFHLTEFLCKRLASLPEEMYHRVMAQLKDPDKNIRRLTADSLLHSLAVPEKALRNISALLRDPYASTRREAAHALLRHLMAIPAESFSQFLLDLDSQSFNELYRGWSEDSYVHHMVWYAEVDAEGQFAYLDTRYGSKRFSFAGLESRVREAQRSLKHPAEYRVEI
ncbi:armadillo-type protein [Nemania sp. NC0429]|nr:armadillo-type protein [Nemania sp. NC0429]